MKKIFAALVVLITVAFCALTCSAATVTSGIYTLETSGSTAKLTRVNLTQYGITNIEIDRTIGGYTITSIGSNVFTRCTYLKSVELPDTVTTLDEFAFSGIESVTLSKSVKTIADGAFSSARGSSNIIVSSITVNSANPYYVMGTDGALYNKNKTELVHYTGNAESFTVPSTVKKIRGYAFAYSNIYPSRALTTVTIPFSVTDIGDFAFYNCENLTTVNFPYGLQTVGDYAFADTSIPSANLPDTVISVGEYAFWGVETLTEAKFPDWLPTISAGTFEGCINLEDFTLPSALTVVDDYAFYDCQKLKAQPMPKGLVEVNYAAFYNCDGLTEAVFGDELTVLSSAAFNKCDKLETVRLSPKLSLIGDSAFSKCPALKEVVVPEGVTNFSINVFNECTSLESIELPDSMISLNSGVFKNCTSLKEVKLPSKLETLNSAFSGCTALEQITIPGTVTTLATGTFNNCTALTDVYFDNTQAVWETIRPDDTYWENITVHFYNGDVSFVENGETVDSLKSYTDLALVAPVGSDKRGYVFSGWALEEGGEAVYKAGDEISDIAAGTVFYGVWEKSVYTVTESLADGNYSVTVVGAPLGSIVVFAAYDGERLAYCTAADYLREAIPFKADCVYDSVKVFIWEKNGMMSPLCEPETVAVQ